MNYVIDARFNAFPKLLQHRIAMFRKFDKNFLQNEEDYESLAMLLGYQIFCACGTVQMIKRFRLEEPYYQIQRVPMIADRNISFNQLEFAYNFAVRVSMDASIMNINNPTHADVLNSEVMMFPNALAPLTGPRCIPRQEYIERYLAEM